MIATDLDFRIQSWNHAAELIYGWRSEEVLGKTVTDVLHTHFGSEKDRDEVVKEFLHQGWWHGEFIQEHHSGAPLYVLGSTTMFKDHNGVPVGVVSVNHNITERKQSEIELQRREKWYRTLAANLPKTTVFLFDQDMRYFVVEGPQTAFPKEFMEGKTVYELFSGERLAQLVPGYEAALRGESTRIERIVGDQVFDGQFVPIRENDGTVSAGLLMVRDISAERHAEQNLRQSEARFRMLVQAAPVAVVITNPEGIIVLVNSQSESLFGYSNNELIGQSLEILVPQPNRDQHIHHRADYVAAPRIRRMGSGMELSALRKDNSQFPVEIELGYIETGDGLLVMSFIMDITERKHAEKMIRESEERYRLVTDHITDVVARLNALGEFVYVSPSSQSVFGYAPDELIGQKSYDFVHPDDLLKIMTYHKSVMEHPAAGQIIYRFRHREGYYIWLETSNQPIISPETHQVTEFVASSRDITERKQAEETLREALQREKELGDLKSRFVSMASHEFRTPLAAILSSSSMLERYWKRMDETQINEKLNVIGQQISHLTSIIDDALDLGRLQAGRSDFRPVVTDLDQFCHDIVKEFQNRPDITTRITYTAQDAPLTLSLDLKLMREVITNLITNAIKYSSMGKRIYVNLTRADEAAILTIRDEGIGIPQSDLDHLFEPFHRATNVGQISGTGLGLSIAKYAVELHGGTITVESQINIGTTFIVKLPIDAATSS